LAPFAARDDNNAPSRKSADLQPLWMVTRVRVSFLAVGDVEFVSIIEEGLEETAISIVDEVVLEMIDSTVDDILAF